MNLVRIVLVVVMILSVSAVSYYVYETRDIQKRQSLISSTTRKAVIEDFGLDSLAILKKQEQPRPLFNFTLIPRKVLNRIPGLQAAEDYRWSMIVAVKSSYKRAYQREIIRRTWGSFHYIGGVEMEVMFVVANADNAESEKGLLKEQALYGDLLQVDMKDVYNNIGLKALAAMQWVGLHFPENWIYSSSDDDILPDFRRLHEAIEDLSTKENTTSATKMPLSTSNIPIFCSFSYRPNASPKRHRCKWQVNVDVYPFKEYPPFCLGGYYSMPVKLSNAIFAVSRHYPYFHLDDVWITGFMRLKFCDLFASGSFPFEKTDKNCGISTKSDAHFLHFSAVSGEKFLQIWRKQEKGVNPPIGD